MHELSIAMSLIEIASEEVARLGRETRVTALHVRLGSLSGVVYDLGEGLERWLELVTDFAPAAAKRPASGVEGESNRRIGPTRSP